MAIKMNGPPFVGLLKMIFHLRGAFDSSPDPNKARSEFPEDRDGASLGFIGKIFPDEIPSSCFQVWEVLSQKFNDRDNRGGSCLAQTGK